MKQHTRALYMNKDEMVSRLIKNHDVFCDLIEKLTVEEFMFAPENKWTAGQQIEHIYLSVRPLNLLFSLPKFLVKAYFGKANRLSKDYDALVQKYKTKLESGYQASGRFLPRPVEAGSKQELIKKLKRTVSGLTKKLGGFSERQLDEMIIPHPLLGKLTVREMMYFTIYHVEHHQILTIRNLEGLKKR